MADPQDQKNDEAISAPASENGSAAAAGNEDKQQKAISASNKVPDEEAAKHLLALLSGMGDVGLTEVTLPPPARAKKKKAASSKQEKFTRPTIVTAEAPNQKKAEPQKQELKDKKEAKSESNAPLLEQWRRSEEPSEKQAEEEPSNESIPGLTAAAELESLPESAEIEDFEAELIQLRLAQQDQQESGIKQQLDLLENEKKKTRPELPSSLQDRELAPLPALQSQSDSKATIAEKMLAAGLELSEGFTLELLSDLQLPMPTQENSGTLSAFIRNTGLFGRDLCAYFQAVFYKSQDKRIQQECLDGLLEEAASGQNLEALEVLQELLAGKAALELLEALSNSNLQSLNRAFTQLALLEKQSALAERVLSESNDAWIFRNLAEEQIAAAEKLWHKCFENFANRELERLQPEQRLARRKNILKKMSASAEQLLKYRSESRLSKKTMQVKVLNILLALKSCDDPQLAHELLLDLRRLKSENNNYAKEELEHMNSATNGDLSEIETALLSADGSDYDALDRLQESSRNPYPQINSIRVELILNKLGPEPGSQDLHELIELLEAERRLGNQQAQERLDWARSAESAKRISEAIARRSLNNIASVRATAETIKREMDRLTSLSKAGNSFARSTLLGIVLSHMDQEDQETWLASQENREIVPDLSLLSVSEHSILAEHAAHALRDVFFLRQDLPPLTLADTTALSQALAHAFESGDRNVRQSIETLFNILLSGSNKNVLVDGLIQTEKTQIDSSPVLSDYLLKAARDGLSNSQLKRLGELARHNAEGGLRTLIGIARGEAGPEQAALASGDLIESARETRYRDQIIRALSSEYEKKGEEPGLLSTLAEISAMDSPCDQLVLDLICRAFNKALTEKKSEQANIIARALLRLAGDWGQQEIEALCRFLENYDAELSLTPYVESLPGHCRAFFIRKQQESILYGKAEKQIRALRRLIDFAPYAGEQVLEDILSLSLPANQEQLADMNDEMKAEFRELAQDFIKKYRSAELETGKPPQFSKSTEPDHESFPLVRQYFPELNQKTIRDYSRRLQAILENWHEDMSSKNLRLLQVEHELLDSEKEYERKRNEIISDPLIKNQILEQLQSSDSWKLKTSLEQKNIIEKNLDEKVLELERKVDSPINKSKQESLRLAKEHDLLLEHLSKFIENRVSELQSLLDYLFEQYDWPKLNLDTIEDCPNAAGYEFGSATIYLPTERLLQAGPQEDFAARLLAQVMQAMQDAALADYSMHKAAGDQSKAREIYKNLCGIDASTVLISEASPFRRSTKSWTGLSEKRLLQLAAALKRRPPGLMQKSEELYLQAKFIEGRLHCLSRNKRGKALESLLEQLYTNAELSPKLYPSGLPEEVGSARSKSLLAISEKSTFHSHEYQDKIVRSLSAVLSEVWQYHDDINRPVQDEIWQETRSAESLLNSPPHADDSASSVTPFEAVKELNKAASREGDSLNVKSDGWEELREMYERKLRESFMSGAQLRILLGLERDLRAQLETLMLQDKIKAQTFSAILKLPAESARKLFALAPSLRERSLFPLLEENRLNDAILGDLLALPHNESRPLFAFLHLSMEDPHCSVGRIHIEKLVSLPAQTREELYKLIFDESQEKLSLQQAAAALLVPARMVQDTIVDDTLTIAQALSRKVLTIEQAASFACLEEDARCGLAVLLANNALNRESCHSLLQKISKGEMSAANVKELGMARLLSNLPEGFVERVLKQDPSVRNALFDRLQTTGSKKNQNKQSFPELVRRLEPLSDLQKAGVVSEALVRMLAVPHAGDLVLMRLLNEQMQKSQNERIGAESIFQLAVLTRTNRLDFVTLESYRRLIEGSVLDRQRLRRQLAEKPHLRKAAETLMVYMPPGFSAILKDGNYEKIARIVEQLPNPLRQVFPDLFDESGLLYLSTTDAFKKVLSIKREFAQIVQDFRKARFEEAFSEVETKFIPSMPKHLKARIEFRETELSLGKILEEHELRTLQQFMHSVQGEERVDREAPSLTEPLSAADPVIVVSESIRFRLRDSQSICENQIWRKTEPHEREFIESIQSSQAGTCIIFQIARLLMDDWANRHLAAGITADIERALRAEFEAEQEEYKQDPYVKMRELLEFAGLKTLRSLQEHVFQGISEGCSNLEFPNGMRARLQMSSDLFGKLESAFNLYMHKLRAASHLEAEDREKAMSELVDIFDRRFINIVLEAGIKVKTANQSYLKLLFDIELERNYSIPGGAAGAPGMDLNLQQGLRRLLCEHPNGKQIYRELASIRYSGITPKYDPSPPSGRPALINPSDQRKLTREQRSAFATAIFNDTTAALRGTFKPHTGDSSVNISVDMSVLNRETSDAARAAFSRAEEWTHLMYVLNDYKALSQGGIAVAELYDKGRLNFLKSKRELLVLKNDFMQLLKELEIEPDSSLYEAPATYRREIESLIEKYLPEMLAKQEAEARESAKATETRDETKELFKFAAGEKVSYNSEPYTVISYDEESSQVFIKYEGESRDPAPVMARYVSDAELASKYRTVEAGNRIHYRSINTRYKTIYVLSTDKSGQKVLHNDWQLRCVLAEDLVSSDFGHESKKKPQITPQDFCKLIQHLFQNSKERALKVADKLVRLGPRQEVLGSSEDAEIYLEKDRELVGARHLQILCTNEEIALQDLHSKLPTFYNWRVLEPYETVILKAGDRVSIGDIDGPELSLIYKEKESNFITCLVGDRLLKPGQTLSIGRLHSADILVSDSGVSKIQATIRMNEDGLVYIKDGGSQGPSNNGLIINNQVLIPGSEQELKPGDRVSTRTGIRLPIICTASQRIQCREHPQKHRNGTDRQMQISTRHGTYIFFCGQCPLQIKQKIAEKKHSMTYRLESISQERPETRLTCTLNEKALSASNQFASNSEYDRKIPDGWCVSSAGSLFAADGSFEAQSRCATCVDRKRDPVLRKVIADARRRFEYLPADKRARALTEHCRELLTPSHLSPEELDQWYDQFSYDRRGTRVLLGEFIKEGKGISTQQSVLLKVLADEFPDLDCKLLRGMNSSHCWTTFKIDGQEIIHDPRVLFFSPAAGLPKASPQARFWSKDKEVDPVFVPDIRPGDLVSFDGSSRWRVLSFDPGSPERELVICAEGNISLNSAELARDNPERLLVIGESYEINRDPATRETESWTLQSINKDGSLQFVKNAAIKIKVPFDRVHLRAQPGAGSETHNEQRKTNL